MQTLYLFFVFLMLPIAMNCLRAKTFRYMRSVGSISAKSLTTGKPTEPIDYYGNFVVNRPNEPLHLEATNRHPRDQLISFDEASHTYTFNNVVMTSSVSQVVITKKIIYIIILSLYQNLVFKNNFLMQLIESFFEKFDADLVISKMMSGPNWPNPKYINPKTKQANTADEIKAQWNRIGEYARNKGTWMHYNFERYFNMLEPSDNLKEMEMMLNFKKDFLDKYNIQPYRTEWRIAAPGIERDFTLDSYTC